MPFPLFLVDAFASRPFTGNPAGVCLLDGPAEEAWMQNVAMEMNQAETAFVYPVGDEFSLRWFTPVSEVDLCGHATLASAHVLWETGRLAPDKAAVFQTLSGPLTCTKSGEEIRMDFPSEAPTECEIPPLLDWLRPSIKWFGENRLDVFAVLHDEQTVRDLTPDFPAIIALGTRGLIVTAEAGNQEYDFVSRYFAPAFGIPEDPVTGSVHCALCPYWSSAIGRKELRGYQASKRGGFVGVEDRGERVGLLGKAVTTVESRLIA